MGVSGLPKTKTLVEPIRPLPYVGNPIPAFSEVGGFWLCHDKIILIPLWGFAIFL